MREHTPPGASHTAYCLPSNKPENCLQSSWGQLKDVFEGDCPENQRPPVVGGIDSITPGYLSVPNFETCLNLQYVSSSSHSEYCLPQTQPINCYNESWTQLENLSNSRLEMCASQDFLGW